MHVFMSMQENSCAHKFHLALGECLNFNGGT